MVLRPSSIFLLIGTSKEDRLAKSLPINWPRSVSKSSLSGRNTRSIGGKKASMAASCRFTTPAVTAAMPILISINTFAPAHRSESFTAIRHSTNSSRKSKEPVITKNALPCCIRRDASSWRTFPSRRFIPSQSFTGWPEILFGKALLTIKFSPQK